MKILITGAAGFIGFSLMQKLASQGEDVIGLDNISNYYDVALKYGRLAECGFERPFVDNDRVLSKKFPNAGFVKADLCDKAFIDRLFAEEKFDKVVNLAAQAGVRYSISNPYSYLSSNLEGFLNILEACRNNGVKHLVFASSSSIYGKNGKVPYSENDKTDSPVSLYAATKKSNELMAHAYSHLYGFAATGLRLFTVYGPWGRPDMAPMLFANAISKGEPIKVFNNGDMSRDFTYIDDIVEGICKVALNDPLRPFDVYNIGCSHPVRLMDFISELENAMGRKAEKVFLPMQAGDVYETYADTTKLEREMGYKPQTSLHDGIARFVAWFTEGMLLR